MRYVALCALLVAACGGAPPRPVMADWRAPSASEVAIDMAFADPAAIDPILLVADRGAAGDVAQAPPFAPLLVREVEIEGLHAIEVIVGHATFEDRLPTLWILHGRGDRARVPGLPFMALSRPVRLVLPQAPTPLGDGFTWLPVRVGDNRPTELARGMREMADRLVHAMETFARTHPLVGRPIVTGFSQGGLLSFAIAILHPRALAFALPNAGWIPPPLMPRRAPRGGFPPIRSAHGGSDDTIPSGPTEGVVQTLRALGADIELRIFDDVGHVMTLAMEDALWHWLEEALARLNEA